MDGNPPPVEVQVELSKIAGPLADPVPQGQPAKLEPVVVFSLHGINTRGEWQKELTEEFGNDFIHAPLDYGDFPTRDFLKPWKRKAKVDWLRDKYNDACVRYGVTRPSIIAHSHGTYMVARALRKYGLRFDRIILCGSIVKRDFPWSSFDTEHVGAVLNDYGGRDFWAGVVEWGVTDAGQSGVKGFTDNANGRVIQRANAEFEHSDYFSRLTYRTVWIPFLKGEIPFPPVVFPAEKANWKPLIVFGLLAIVAIAVVCVVLHYAGFSLPFWRAPVQQAEKISLKGLFVDRQVLSGRGTDFAALRTKWEKEPPRAVEFSAIAMRKIPIPGQIAVQLTVIPVEGIDNLVKAINVQKQMSADEEQRFRNDAYATCVFQDPTDAAALNIPAQIRIRGELHGRIDDGGLLFKECVIVK